MSKLMHQEEVAAVRRACAVVMRTLDFVTPHIRAGVSTGHINDLCHQHITEAEQAVPASLDYKGFPKSICTSINNVICHGIPRDDKILQAGDIVNVDIAVEKDGYYGDSSRMFCIGKVNPFARRLVDVTRQALYQGIKQVKSGNTLGDVGAAIQEYAEEAGFSVVYEYCGHGIGKEMHCMPQVLHYGTRGHGEKLTEGMCFTIEPMINAGSSDTRLLSDNWTVVTKDSKLSAQWEHTLYINEQGQCEVLTLAPNEIIT
ncbi:MAG: type I methionyl aminopeptidase [Gammaproteobacteria bacterium]|nr:type I methionyl aminopeptidase [Gammaproteobacteria bacterium]